MSKNVLVLVESQEGKVKKTSIELLSEGSKVASSLGGSLYALLIGSDAEATQIKDLGVTEVLVAKHELLSGYSPEVYTSLLEEAVKISTASLVLVTSNSIGKDFLPRLAVRLNAGIASDCVSIKVQGDKVAAIRPVYSGKAMVEVSFASEVALISCRPNVFEIQKKSPQDPKVTALALSSLTAPKAKIKEVVAGKSDKADLSEAEVIVAAGRSIKSAENFAMINELASVLSGAVGASRAAVDAGFASHSIQVGQTGKTVNPKLYIACGISGAIQHLAGMRSSKVIVAINTDPEAPIFQNCDYGVVGDMFTLVPLMTQEFKKLLAE